MTSLLRHWFLPHAGNKHRAKILHPDGLVVIALLLILIHVFIALALRTGPLKKILGYSSDITTDKVLNSINAQRAGAGLKPLSNNAKLAQAAQLKAQDMLAKQYWSHNSPDGKQPWNFMKQAGYRYEVAGENLARNFSHTDGMVTAWLNSSTHRANILSDKYSETGIAVVNGTFGSTETTLVVQMFGSPSKPAIVQAVPPQPTPEKAQVTEVALAQPEVSSALAPGPAAVLGDEVQTFQPLFSPLDLYRWASTALLGMLIAVLIHDMIGNPAKKRSFFGKNIAHVVMLFAAITTLALSQGGKLL